MSSPDDKGVRDPVGLPRAKGTVRTSYQMNKAKENSQENASYTTKSQSMDELEAFYAKALTGDGWVEERRWENNNGLGNTHQLIIRYYKVKDSLNLTFTDVKPGEVMIDIKLDRVF